MFSITAPSSLSWAGAASWARAHNLMGKRHGGAFSVMTDSIMERFLDHLGYQVLTKDADSFPRDVVWIEVARLT